MTRNVTTAKDEQGRGLYATVAESAPVLERHVDAWAALVSRAAEPNPFYEPYALLAAWRNLAPPTLRVVLVWAPNVLPGQPPRLAGLFPIVRRERYKSLPLTVFSTWHHLFTYHTTPLVDGELASGVLEAFFAWLRASDATLFEWQAVTADGAFRHALIDTLDQVGATAFHDSSHTRAFFKRAVDIEGYLERAMSGKKRKELRRQERRLAETGNLVFEQLTQRGNLDAWLDEFLELEALGWKGQGGSALINDRAALATFRAYAHGAFERQRWMMLAMRLDGRAIAMKCNLLAGDGAIAFKIAYDESYARYSPGVLLELEHLRLLHEPGAPLWMDSGAAADHAMIGHLWRDRIAIETLVMPTGRVLGELAVAALPFGRWIARALRGTLHQLRERTRRT